MIDSPPGINHGLVALSGVLKHGGHETRMIYANEQLGPLPTHAGILETVRAWKPGLLAFSVMSQQYAWAVEVAKACKAAFPALPSVVGGVHVTMVPEEVTAQNHFDYVCVGEGDYALLELVNRLARGEDTTKVPNLRMIRDGQTIVNPVAPFPDLATLPPLDYDLFDVPHIVSVKKGWMGLLTSRGCPYKCTYCFNKEIVDQYVADGAAKRMKEFLRTYPTPRILDEIRALKARAPEIRTLIFDDDLFTLNKQYVKEFCAAYAASGIGIPFVVNAHVQQFDEDIASVLKSAGCLILKFGLESGSERVRKEILWRPMSNVRIAKSFEAAHAQDLHTSAFVMFGLPTETLDEIFETIDLCAQVQMGRFRWAIFFPFPGTAGYTIARDKGLIDDEKMKGMGNYFDGSCLRFSPEQDLFIEKLGRFFHWYVTARTSWASAKIYEKLVARLDGMNRKTWEASRDDLIAEDRELSDALLAKDILHYSVRYSHVMGVRSDYVQWEKRALAAAGVPKDYTLDQ
jgi:radical SAM superfamily enzyme YgiQ (UPF0313 family)